MRVPDLSTELDGKVAIVTGGGSGIGRAIAERYAAGGGTVYVLGRRLEPLQETVALLAAAGHTGHAVACDVRDASQLAEIADGIADAEGRIDALVNNAAGNFIVPGEELTPNGWRAVLDIVLNGTFFATHAVAKHMLEQGSGSILNVIATYAWHGHPGTVHSAAAKGGVVAMTRTLAVEWAARGVRVNCIAPGPTETEGAGKALWGSDAARTRVLGSVPAGRFAEPGEIAESGVHLLSDRADYVTGEVLVVDGGQWLGKSVYTAEKALS